MTHIIHCQKLKKSVEGLEAAPFPGPLGEKIYQHISKEAWQLWLGQQTILINEYRLNTADSTARDFLKAQMRQFLFEEVKVDPSQGP